MKFPAFHRHWLDSIQLTLSSLPGGKLTLINLPGPVNGDKTLNKHNEQVISGSKKRAAVLIPLCNRKGIPSVLFTVRTMALPTHKGQVSFPGGHLHVNESAVDAAIRETYEELGKNIGNIDVLGVCQTIPAITGTAVTPIIAFISEDVNDLERYSPDNNEVDHIFTRSLAELCSPGFRNSETLSRNGISIESPYYGSGEERIWGFTAFVLDAVLNKIVYPTIPK